MWACSTGTPVEVTREVEVTRAVTVPQTVLVEVAGPVREATKLVEVTRVVEREVTREIEVTRQTYVEVTPTPTSEPTATPTPTLSPDIKGLFDQELVDRDREALVALYHATDGPNWINNDKWLSNRPLNEWFGISGGETNPFFGHSNPTRSNRVAEPKLKPVDEPRRVFSSLFGKDRRVTAVDLSANGLRGTIPPDIGNLDAVERLLLDRNALSGELPSELGSLSELAILDLSRNQLSGQIPPAIFGPDGIHPRALYLNDNQFTGLHSDFSSEIRYTFVGLDWLLDNNRFADGACVPITLPFHDAHLYQQPPRCNSGRLTWPNYGEPFLPDWVDFSPDPRGVTYWERAAMFGFQWSHELAIELGIRIPADRTLSVRLTRPQAGYRLLMTADRYNPLGDPPGIEFQWAFQLFPFPREGASDSIEVGSLARAATEMAFAFMLDGETSKWPSWLVNGFKLWLTNSVRPGSIAVGGYNRLSEELYSAEIPGRDHHLVFRSQYQLEENPSLLESCIVTS